MLNKAMLLGASKPKASEESQTTGKFTMTNGYSFVATDPDMSPTWGNTTYGYWGSVGSCDPVPTLMGYELEGLAYLDSSDMGTYGVRADVGGLWDSRNAPARITLINYTNIYTSEARNIGNGQWGSQDTSYEALKCFTPEGSQQVWEIRAGSPGPVLTVEIEIGGDLIQGTVTDMYFYTLDGDTPVLQYSQTWGKHSLPIDTLDEGTAVYLQTEISTTTVVTQQNVDVNIQDRIIERIYITVTDRSKDAYVRLRVDGT